MDETQNEVLQESEFVKLLVRGKIISEGQLKAVYDYQRSVGGSVLDILVKLNMLSRSEIERMLQAAIRGEDVAVAVGGRSIVAIDAKKLDVDVLKLHHRLIDKIPMEIIERCVLTVFFPAPNLDSRRLIVGHGRDLPEGLAERISSTLGIEVYTLALDEALGADFVIEFLERAKKPVSDEMKSLRGATRRKERVARPAAQPAVAKVGEAAPVVSKVSKEELSASNEMAHEGQAGSRSDAGAPPAVDDSSSLDALPKNPTDETKADDTRDDHEIDSAGDDRTTRDATQAGAAQAMNRPSDAKSMGKNDPSIAWTALLNLLVKKSVLTHEEVRVEIELLKRHQTRF